MRITRIILLIFISVFLNFSIGLCSVSKDDNDKLKDMFIECDNILVNHNNEVSISEETYNLSIKIKNNTDYIIDDVFLGVSFVDKSYKDIDNILNFSKKIVLNIENGLNLNEERSYNIKILNRTTIEKVHQKDAFNNVKVIVKPIACNMFSKNSWIFRLFLEDIVFQKSFDDLISNHYKSLIYSENVK